MKSFLKTFTVSASMLMAMGATAESIIAFDPVPTRRTGDRALALPHARPLGINRTLAAPLRAEATDPSLHANLIYTSDWEYADNPAYGIYSFPLAAGSYTSFPSVYLDNRICGNAGAVYADGWYFTATSQEVNTDQGYVVISMDFYLFDTRNWSVRKIENADEEFKAVDMTYSPAADRVFGCFVKRGPQGYYYFGSLDIQTGETTLIRNYGQQAAYGFTGMAATPEGVIYAINNDGGLYTVEPSTGVPTYIGETGLKNQYTTSATFDAASGKIYYALNADYRQAMYAIDPATAKAEKMYDFYNEESLTGLYVPVTLANENVPAAPSALAATFDKGSLTGDVSFTAPSTSVGGTPLEGNLNYVVRLNGEDRATGTVVPGAVATASVSALTRGNYSISVVCSNSSGEGERASMHRFIGCDTPLPVTDVIFVLDDAGEATVSWNASVAANGGYLDPEALKYVVTRLPDGAQTTVSSSTTRFVETISEPASRTRYTYTVEAVSGDATTEAVASNAVWFGTYKAPCNFDFTASECTEDLVLTDGDKDGKTWMWQSGQMHSSICLTKQVDDYLVLPPVYLHEGMSYRVSVDAHASKGVNIYPERMALWVGRQSDAIDERILEPTVINHTDYRNYSCDYRAEADGVYYFAVQSCSDRDSYYLWVDNFAVGAPVSAAVPAAVSALKAEAGADGKLEVTLSFTLPTVDLNGAPLDGLTSVEIYRDGKVVDTSIEPLPGKSVTFTDHPENGAHTYGVATVSANGRSHIEEVNVYVGVHEPKAVTAVSAVAGEHNGQIALSWTAPATDVEGVTLPDGSLTYRVTRYDRAVTVVADGLVEPCFTDNASEADAAQEFVQYMVEAVNVAGVSEEEYSNVTTYGRLNAAPMIESFAGSVSRQEFVVERADDNASWTVTSASANPGTTEYDNDGGMLRFTGVTTGDSASFISGSYSVDGMAHPALMLHFLYPTGTNRALTATIYTEEGGVASTVSREAAPAEGISGWQRLIMPLEGNPDKVQIILTGENYGEYALSFYVDDIRLIDLPTPNVNVSAFSAPAIVEANCDFNLRAYVENSGATDVTATVSLLLNGETVEQRDMALAMGDHVAVDFIHMIPTVAPEHCVYTVEVTTDGDADATDNVSEAIEVKAHHSIYPAPVNLGAVMTDAGVQLSWTEPDLGPVTPVAVEDDLESYEPFSIGITSNTEIASDYMGQWSSVDADGLWTIGLGHGSALIPNASVPKGFMVFNGPAGNISGDAWKAHSGDNMFVAFAAIADPGEGNDDWLISPMLTGDAQEVAFWARSATDLYGLESLEVLYSKDGKELSEFVPRVAVDEVPAEWTRYTVRLPEGARYFAVRCVSENMFALLLDDFTYIPAGFRGMGLELDSYGIYRDGKHITDVTASEHAYLDAAVTGESRPTYSVVACYNLDESRPVTVVTADPSGIADVDTTTAISVTGLKGRIVIEHVGDKAVAVIAADGRVMYRTAKAPDTLNVELPAGVYFVQIAGWAIKTVVR